MTLEQKHQALVAEMTAMRDPQQRLAWVVARGRGHSPFPETLKDEAHRVAGCLSQLWWAGEMEGRACRFRCDSDSAVVKGVAALLCEFYSGFPPGDVLKHEGNVLEDSGILKQLTSSRRNGLGRVHGLILEFCRCETAVSASPPPGPFYDAHNHLQDPRFGEGRDDRVREAVSAGVARMVVNGSCEEDWPMVLELARRHPCVIPSLGYHPWHLAERTASWREVLRAALEGSGAAVGEIGLDRWKATPDIGLQEEMFEWQWRLAVELDRPVSVHCLKAWGRLEELLRRLPRARRGFLLHSYGGPPEMVRSLASLGGYFGFPGYFLLDRKARQRETFRSVPADRLLVETDAPDQLLPEDAGGASLTDPTGAPINHPANITAVYQGLARFLDLPLDRLIPQVESSFRQLFGS